MVRVATFNLHAGVDGWGRPTRVLDHVAQLDADILVLPELWRGDDGEDLFELLRHRLGMSGAFAPLATAQRVTSGQGGRSWQPWLAHFTGERGLYFDEHRTLTRFQEVHRGSLAGLQHGDWGLGLLTRFEIQTIDVVPLDRLPRERVRRALIVAKLHDGTRPFHVLAVHGAHLSHGSYRQYRAIAAIAAALDATLPVIMAGDFNSWRPLLRVLLPGWRSMVRARTWPARLPHSQIDHILARGPVVSRGGFASDGGSDHRALVADLTWAQ